MDKHKALLDKLESIHEELSRNDGSTVDELRSKLQAMADDLEFIINVDPVIDESKPSLEDSNTITRAEVNIKVRVYFGDNQSLVFEYDDSFGINHKFDELDFYSDEQLNLQEGLLDGHSDALLFFEDEVLGCIDCHPESGTFSRPGSDDPVDTENTPETLSTEQKKQAVINEELNFLKETMEKRAHEVHAKDGDANFKVVGYSVATGSLYTFTKQDGFRELFEYEESDQDRALKAIFAAQIDAPVECQH